MRECVRRSILPVFLLLLFAAQAQGQAQVPTVNNLAGGVPAAGAGTAASLNALGGIGRDASGNVYFASASGVVLKLDISGNISVFAGNGTCCFSGEGGAATSAQTSINPFSPVSAVKVDPSGNVYFVDTGACVVRMIPAGGGNIATVAGTPNTNFVTFPNCNFGGDGGLATNATMQPAYVAFNPAGDMYIADQSVCVIRKVDHVTRRISTVAGNAAAGCTGSLGVGDGLPATSAQFVYPYGLAVDGAGNIYIGDFIPITGPGDVRRVDAGTNLVSTFGGGGATLPTDGTVATNAVFGGPTGLDFDSSGNLVIADTGLNMVMSENPTTKILTLLAGNIGLGAGFSGDGGAATSAQLHGSRPGGVLDAVIDASGTITLTDTWNYRVRRVDGTTKIINTVAGNGSAGDGGPATSAILFASGTAVDGNGNVYIADLDNGRVRKVDHTTGLISTVAGSDVGPTPAPGGDGQPATSAQLFLPRFPAVDSAGNIYVVDNSTTVRQVDAGSGLIFTYAGIGTTGYSGDGGSAASAQLNNPRGLAVNAAGDLFIADAGNQEVRVVDHSSQNINAAAGNHALGAGYSGDGGAATQAQLNSPSYVALDAAGDLFIADRNNNVIRRVDASTQKITTVAGNFAMGAGFSGDGGPATMAQLNSPRAAGVDVYGNLYIADGAFSTNRMRMVNSVTGIITTLGGTGAQNFSGDGGPAASAGMSPTSVSVASGAGGNILVYFSDALSARVRVITVPPVPAVFLVPAAGLTFASTAIGSTGAPQTVTIYNSGTGTLNVSNVAITGSNAGDFVIVPGGTCTGTSFALAPTASCTVMVASKPLSTGALTAALSFTDDAGGSPHVVPLSGSGSPGTAVTCTITFNVTSGDWETGANWMPTGPPATTDTACIPSGRTATIATSSPTVAGLSVMGTLTISAGPLTVNGQTDLSGTLNGTGDVTVNGLLNWTGGTQDGGGVTNANGGALISGNLVLLARTINLAGNTAWNGRMDNGQGGVINNSATLEINGDLFAPFSFGGAQPVLNNAGTITKTAGTGASNISLALNNTQPGTLSVASGTASFRAGGTSTGSFSATGTGVLDFGGGTHSLALNAAASISGTGTVSFSGGTVNLSGGTYNVTGGTTFSGATATFSAAATVTSVGQLTVSGGTATLSSGEVINASALNQSGGTLTGTDTVNAAGLFIWTGGTQDGGGITNANGGAQISGNDVLLSRTINLAGTSSWNGRMDSGQGGIINNTGTLNINGDLFAPISFGGAQPTLSNSGTITKTAGTGTSNISLALNNTQPGTLSVASGTLSFLSGGTSTGSFSASGTGVLDFHSGTFDLTAATANVNVLTGGTVAFSGGTITLGGAVTGAGTVQFSGATANLNRTYAVTGTTSISGGTANFSTTNLTSFGPLNLSNGTLTGTALVAATGLIDWTGGTITATGGAGFSALGGITMDGGDVTLDGRTLNCNSNATLSGAGNKLQLQNGAMWTQTNTTTFEIKNDGGITNSGGTATFINNGTVLRSTSTNSATINLTFNNNALGAVHVQTGALMLAGLFNDTSSGSVTVDAGATLNIQRVVLDISGPVNGPGSIPVSGNAIVNFHAGSSVTNVATLTFNTSTLFVDTGVNLTVPTITGTGSFLKGLGTITGNVTAMSNTIVLAGSSTPGLFMPGVLTITGNFTMDASSTLASALGGPTPGTSGYSELIVNGMATLAGNLSVQYFGTFTASPGDSYVLVLPTSLSGTFTNPLLPAPPTGSTFNLSYAAAPTGVVLMATSSSGATFGAAPNPLVFGNQPKGTMSAAMTLTFSNPGTAALMITGGLTPAGGNAGDFAQVIGPGTGTCGALPITVAANGGSCTVMYTFTPSTAGPE
ncbi:MAG TPA: choice-of-anchor D domain-containing protein, partial [Candidatus Acidoferrales bacterium]|nr:choice-of-anchor D domain-containing protein [Candidatus Acidoferrales bacterium]